jgi:hypothetical protein
MANSGTLQTADVTSDLERDISGVSHDFVFNRNFGHRL